MHKATHSDLRVKSGKSGKVYDTRGLRWFIREKKLDGGYLQYNLYVEHEENAVLAYRNKGRILRVMNRRKKFTAIEMTCDTGSYMVTLDKAIPEKFPPELRNELSEHEKNKSRNGLFCSKYFNVFWFSFISKYHQFPFFVR